MGRILPHPTRRISRIQKKRIVMFAGEELVHHNFFNVSTAT